MVADPTFERDIDALSVEVIELLEAFVIAHRKQLLGDDIEVHTVLRFLVGWIAEFQSPDVTQPSADHDEMLDRLRVVAFGMSRSAGNGDKIRRRLVQ